MSDSIELAALDFPLRHDGGADWSAAGTGLAVRAAASTDLFVDPSGTTGVAAETLLNATTLLGDPGSGDFVLSARTEVSFRDTFDAGVLLVWIDDHRWAKLCFERSPAGEHMVVSVVTRGTSDDANAAVVEAGSVHLRIARAGRVVAFHSSADGLRWAFVRAFTLEGVESAQVGFEAQSPVGDGCDVVFDQVRFERRTLQDLRDGS